MEVIMELNTSELILNWIGAYGAYVQFFVQIFFWIAIAFCAISATRSFKRFVRECHTEQKKASSENEGASQASSNAESEPKVEGFID